MYGSIIVSSDERARIGAMATNIPDIAADPTAWFRYFDPNGDGLDKEEVLNALIQTLSLDSTNSSLNSLRSTLNELWPLFDPDGSGRISLREFSTSGGLAEIIVAQLPHLTNSCGTKHIGVDKTAIAELQSIFPHAALSTIEHALSAAHGNKEEAINALLINPSDNQTAESEVQSRAPSSWNNVEMPAPPAVSVPAPPVPAPPLSGAAAVAVPTRTQPPAPKPESNCCVCHSRCAMDIPATLPQNVRSVTWYCPSCSTPNQYNIPVVAVGTVVSPPPVPIQYATATGSGSGSGSSSGFGSGYGGVGTYEAYQHNQQQEHPFRPAAKLREQRAPPRAPPPTGGNFRKRALLVGINYRGQRGQLRGCVNDVRNMYRLLTITYSWPANCIKVLTDETMAEYSSAQPTKSNIISALRWLVSDVRPGDALFFHYSGHGAQQEDPHGIEEDGMNETILPVDFKRAGMITDDQISEIIVQTLPEGVRLTAVLDCCHSGTGLDLPYTWTIRTRRFIEETNPYHSLGDVQLFSGCEDGKTSADAAAVYCAPGGAMTTAFCEALRQNPCPTYVELLQNVLVQLQQRGFKQRPQLSSSQRFSVDRPFLLDDAVPNGNATIGRTKRRHFPPRRRVYNDPNFAGMMGMGAALLGGMMLADVLF